jgi:DNA-binding GntR family transcriptional regulator
MKRTKKAVKSRGGSDEARQSSGQIVYALLREKILSMEMAPNAELDEVRISNEMGFSRTPIREALIRLASDGLVVLAPNRSARVAPLDFDQLPQILEALELYERVTTRWAALRRQPAHIDLLEQRNAEFEQASAGGNPRLIVEANWMFHDVINQACGNKFLAADCSKMLRSVMRLSILAFKPADARKATYGDVVEQHRQMIAAIKNRDPDAAEKLVFRHSDEFRDRIKSFVAGTNTSDFSLSPRK